MNLIYKVKKNLSILGKIWKFVSTGVARPNSKSAQDKIVDINGVENYFKVRYKYSPGSTGDNPRDFCVAMTRAKKLYRKEDIIAMDKESCKPRMGSERCILRLILFGYTKVEEIVIILGKE